MFNLPQSPEQLSVAFERSANCSYQSYYPTASCTGNNFSSGEITIPFSLSSPYYWVPNKSYIRLVVELSFPNVEQKNPDVVGMGSGSPFLQYQGIAPNMFMASSLFSRMSLSANGVIINNVTDWLPQITAMTSRVLRPRALLDSFEYSKDFTSGRFHDRASRVTMPTFNLGVPGQSDTALSVFDLGLTYPPVGNGLVITLNSGGTAAVITLTQPGYSDGAGLAAIRDYIRAGDVLSVLEGPTQQVLFQGLIRDFVVDSSTQATVTLTNTSGATGAANIGGAVGNPAQIFIERQEPTQIANVFELCFRPPLSAFQGEHAIPAGAFMEVKLQPWSNSVYPGRAIESLQSNRVPGRDFQVVVRDLNLQLYTCAGPRIEQLQWLWEQSVSTQCQAQAITVQANSLQQLNYDISSSTYWIGIAIQGRNLNDTAQSCTKFTVGRTNLQQAISRCYLTYKGMTVPAQLQTCAYRPYARNPDPVLNPPDSAGIDGFVDRYSQHMQSIGLAFSAGGCETEQEWLERGNIFGFYVPSDVSAQSTRLQVNIEFSQDLSQVGNVLVFSVSREVASVNIDGGRWTSVVMQQL